MLDRLATPLCGSVVSLEPLAAGHEAGLRAAASDPRIFAWMPYRLSEPAVFEAWFAGVREATARRELAAFATVSRASGEVLGSTSFLAPRPHDRSVEIGGTLRDSAWYSVIDREWPGVRANLTRRLAARQKIS